MVYFGRWTLIICKKVKNWNYFRLAVHHITLSNFEFEGRRKFSLKSCRQRYTTGCWHTHLTHVVFGFVRSDIYAILWNSFCQSDSLSLTICHIDWTIGNLTNLIEKFHEIDLILIRLVVNNYWTPLIISRKNLNSQINEKLL